MPRGPVKGPGEVVREQPLTVYVNGEQFLLKAARMGVPLVASRTSPTEMAIGLDEQLGITVVGYLRLDSLNLYAGDALDLG